MKLNDTLPKKHQIVLSKLIDKNEIIRFSLASDLTASRNFGENYVVVTSNKIVVLDEKAETFSITFDELKEVKIEELFGGSRLIAETEKESKVLVYYTKVRVPEFAVLYRVINDIIKGKEPLLPEEDENSHCHKCGRPLPERGGNCPVCVPRIKILFRLLSLVAPYKFKVTILMITTFLTVGAQLGPPYITKLIVDNVIKAKQLDRLTFFIGLLIGLGLLHLAATYTSRGVSAWLAGRVVADIRTQLHSALQRLCLRYFHKHESGELIGRIMHDTNELEHFLLDGLPFFLVNSISFVAIAGLLVYLDAKLAIFVFLPVPFLIFGGGWFWKKLIPLFHKYGSKIGALHSLLGESIKGIRVVKAYSREEHRANAFDTKSNSLFNIGFAIDKTFIGFSEVMFWIMSLGVTAVWFFASKRIAVGDPTLTLGDLIAFVGYLWLFYGPLQWFSSILNWMSHAFAGAERIFAVLDSSSEIYDAPDSISLPIIHGAIKFDDVHFSYERGKEVLKKISFEIKPGEMIGLVGKSGVGKSTLIKLLCRFYHVDSGLLTVDGHPIEKIKLNDLRKQIGTVLQEPFLFNDSIFENIRYGTPSASFEDVARAAKAANAHDFILNKEDGYDTVIGEGGENLSGGERQRVAIARAILDNPPILILDEATSSVDSETEKAIQEAIAHLIKGRTTIAIAHRLATLRNAHKLIILDEGKIAEMGTHEELLEKDGIYAKLVKIQQDITKLKQEVWHE